MAQLTKSISLRVFERAHCRRNTTHTHTHTHTPRSLGRSAKTPHQLLSLKDTPGALVGSKVGRRHPMAVLGVLPETRLRSSIRMSDFCAETQRGSRVLQVPVGVPEGRLCEDGVTAHDSGMLPPSFCPDTFLRRRRFCPLAPRLGTGLSLSQLEYWHVVDLDHHNQECTMEQCPARWFQLIRFPDSIWTILWNIVVTLC